MGCVTRDRRAHDVDRRRHMKPPGELMGGLRDEHLEAAERDGALRACRAQQVRVCRVVDEVVDQAGAEGRGSDQERASLRWELEEVRVATYAQELAARGATTAKKLAARIAALG